MRFEVARAPFTVLSEPVQVELKNCLLPLVGRFPFIGVREGSYPEKVAVLRGI